MMTRADVAAVLDGLGAGEATQEEATDAARQLRAVLATFPTPGPWHRHLQDDLTTAAGVLDRLSSDESLP